MVSVDTGIGIARRYEGIKSTAAVLKNTPGTLPNRLVQMLVSTSCRMDNYWQFTDEERSWCWQRPYNHEKDAEMYPYWRNKVGDEIKQ